jgi:hypothetical protein
LGLRVKSDLPVKIKKPAITIHHLEADAELKLAQTDRTEGKRPRIALLQVVGSIQDAPEEDAMGEGEHVGCLVNQDLAASSQQNPPILLSPLLPVKGRVVSGKAEDPDVVAERRLTENEIPRRFGIEILHGDGQKAEGIGWKLPLEEGQNIGGQDLPSPCMRVMAGGEFGWMSLQRREYLCVHGKVSGCVLSQYFHGRTPIHGKSTQRLQVDLAAGSVGFLRLRPYKIVEGLTGFRVDGQPVAGFRSQDRFKIGPRV